LLLLLQNLSFAAQVAWHKPHHFVEHLRPVQHFLLDEHNFSSAAQVGVEVGFGVIGLRVGLLVGGGVGFVSSHFPHHFPEHFSPVQHFLLLLQGFFFAAQVAIHTPHHFPEHF